MFLRNLKLENIRCFEDAEIDFDLPGGNNRKWTVLVGENGGGKTTILQSIALVMAGADALKVLLGDVDSWIRVGAGEATIKAEIETAKGHKRPLELVLKRGDAAETVAKRSLRGASALNAAIKRSTRNYLTVGYGTLRRRSTDADSATAQLDHYINPRARSIASLFDRDVPLQPLEQWISVLVSDSSQQAAGIVAELVETFLPEFEYSRIADDGRIMFETDDGEIPLHRLGNGYQAIIAFVGDLLYQITNTFGDFKNPLNARGLLMVDSIGMDLHPKLQRRLLAFLEEQLPRLQLIVSTQSLVITQQSPVDALHYGIRRDGPVEIVQFEGEPRKLRLNQLMMTDAFGDTTYESLEVEQQKQRYRELEDQTRRSAAETREMNEIHNEIGHRPLEDIGAGLTDEQLQLLADVKEALAEKE